ncbi:signal peptidase II [Chloroflexales bacterium ZM16-3]|nr:signal peptidase II [Chloroflexales bacterium ZM16-3]
MSALPRSIHRRWAIPAALGILVFVCDQLSKGWIISRLGPEPFLRVMSLGPSWLRLVYTQNTGVAFGLFQSMPELFTVTSILITIGAIYAYVVHLPNRVTWVQVSMGLIIGGAVGNILDRLRLGAVVDFISVGWWPVFNLADSAITVGVTAMATYLIFIGDDLPTTPPIAPRDDGLLSDLLSRDLE